jgi:NitT/TauT family transport system permease protein
MSMQSSLEPALGRTRSADGLARSWPAWLDPRELVWRFGAITLFLALWELLPRVGLISTAFVPPFSKALMALAKGLLAGELGRHLLWSLGRSLAGFSLALCVGLPLGFVLGRFRKLESYLDPLIQVFRQTSAFALFPLFILLLGIGEVSKVAIIFYGAQWYVLLNTISGVKDVDPLLIKLARSLRLSHLQLFRKIILPAALPTIFTGLRLSATLSILIIVSAEMMGASEGLGLVLVTAQYNFDVLQMYAAIMLLALIGYATNALLVLLEKRLTGWKPEAARY